MKKSLLSFLLILPFFSQAQFIANAKFTSTPIESAYVSNSSDVNTTLSSDLPGARKTRKGTVLIVTGSILAGLGTSLLATSDGVVSAKLNESKGNGTYGAANLRAELGTLLIVGGVGMLVPGIIIHSKGKKMNRAPEAENKVSLHMQGAGLKLQWKL
jgi:hypothetical protein